MRGKASLLTDCAQIGEKRWTVQLGLHSDDTCDRHTNPVEHFPSFLLLNKSKKYSAQPFCSIYSPSVNPLKKEKKKMCINVGLSPQFALSLRGWLVHSFVHLPPGSSTLLRLLFACYITGYCWSPTLSFLSLKLTPWSTFPPAGRGPIRSSTHRPPAHIGSSKTVNQSAGGGCTPEDA